MDRIETLMIQAVAIGTLMFAVGAGWHAADLAYVASLPVVQLERVVVTSPVNANVAQETPATAAQRDAI